MNATKRLSVFPGLTLSILAVFMLFFISSPQPAGGEERWTHQALTRFLQKNRNQDAVLVQKLVVEQNGEPLPIYRSSGREEVRQKLRQRLILVPASAQGPFVRGTEFIARVDRSSGISLHFQGEHVSLRTPDGKLLREPIRELFIRVKPSGDLFPMKNADGAFQLFLAKTLYCSEARLEYYTPQGQHEFTIRFLNQKTPVTLSNPESR